METTNVSKGVCPGCGKGIEVEPRIKIGDWMKCPHCWADLEVIDLNPVTFDWAYDGPEIAGPQRPWSRLGGDC